MERRRKHADAFEEEDEDKGVIVPEPTATDDDVDIVEEDKAEKPKGPPPGVLVQCTFCGRNLPSVHILDLHLLEAHDTFFQLRLEKGSEKLSCLDSECPEKFGTVDLRKTHVLAKHPSLPPSYKKYFDWGDPQKKKEMVVKNKKNESNTNASSTGKKFGQSSRKVFMDLSDLKKVLPPEERKEVKEKP